MFEVIFEVHPTPEKWDTYLSIAGGLKPILESQRGFLANIRYRSLTRPGWLLSLSDWQDEKALVRWRTQGGHHIAQERGRGGVLTDYHLRVGEVLRDSDSQGRPMEQQRLDQTEVGQAKVVCLMNVTIKPLEEGTKRDARQVLDLVGFDVSKTQGLVAWDAFEAILTPGEILLLSSWTDLDAAEAVGNRASATQRTRHVRVIRDYGMFDRVEAPQYYPDVKAA